MRISTLFKTLPLCFVCTTALAASGEMNIAPMTTPENVPTQMGTFQLNHGIPDKKTTDAAYDLLDHQQGVNAFLNSFAGVSAYAIRKGLIDAGVHDNDVLIFSKLMDSKSLFLTANADTVYFMSIVDLSKGPMVIEVPPQSLGIFDDIWFRWVSDFGLPGPDRGLGGKYLLVPPGYKGTLPESGYFVGYSRTNHVGFIGRSFLENNDPAPVVALIKKSIKIYPYVAGSFGSSISAFLEGKSTLAPLSTPMTPKFVEGSGLAMNTLPPNDFSYYQMLNDLVQLEPASALDPELAGQFAAIGIVKGEAFHPDARMTKILNDAVAVGNVMSRVVSFTPRDSEGFAYYDNASAWLNPLFKGGYNFMTPPPNITKDGLQPYPDKGAKLLDPRTAFFYVATGVTPAMCMRLTDIGSQYLFALHDSKGIPFDGAKQYKVTLPANIPAEKFWSLTVYDNQTRSMLETAQRFPRAGSQSFPSKAATTNADGSITVYFAPQKPSQASDGNWIQTVPGKGWFVILRLYSPQISFFSKTWRPSEVEPV